MINIKFDVSIGLEDCDFSQEWKEMYKNSSPSERIVMLASAIQSSADGDPVFSITFSEPKVTEDVEL